MRKRMLGLMLSLAMITGLLLGCGGGGSSEENTNTDTDTSATDTSAEASENTESTETTDSTTPDEPQSASGDKVKIGVACNNFNDKWQVYMRETMATYAEENYPEYEFIFADGTEDINKQTGQVEDFISSGCQAIVLVAVNTDAAGSITQACKDADIPLVTVNRLLSNQEDATAYVGSESIEAGIMQAEYMFEQMGGKGNVAILQGLAGNEATVERTNGVKQVAEKYPDINIVVEDIANWNRDEAMIIVEGWIQSGTQIDAILSNNDEMAIGAVLALQDAGKREGDDKVLVAGVDATIDALEYMKNGDLDMTVFQSPFGQAETAVDVVIQAVKGEQVEPYNWVDYEPVTPDKVDEYIAKWS